MIITADQLKACAPYIKPQNQAAFAPAISNILNQYQITTPLRLAHFLAQVIHESGSLNVTEENLHYSASLLVKIFPHFFPTLDKALPYDNKPDMIANYIYANRMGNGDTASGEGYKFRGRGLIQTTGKLNYKAVSMAVGVDFVEHPELLTQASYASLSVGYFWNSHGLNTLADHDDIKNITIRINGGTNGLAERTANLVRCKSVLGVH